MEQQNAGVSSLGEWHSSTKPFLQVFRVASQSSSNFSDSSND